MARSPYAGVIGLVSVSSAPSDPAAPTQAEITAGTDLIGAANDEALANIDGLTVNGSVQDTPDFVSLATGNVPGRSTVGLSTLTFYLDDTTTTIFDLMVEGATGYLIYMPQDAGSGNPSTVWGYRVIARTHATPSDEAQQFVVPISTGTPTDGTQAA